jgi:hypothetical protein
MKPGIRRLPAQPVADGVFGDATPPADDPTRARV